MDPQTYQSSGEAFVAANHDLCDIVAAAADGAQWSRGMAGSDAHGARWAQDYDRAAAAVLRAGSVAVDAVGWIGTLLLRSGQNHADADAASTSGGPPVYPGSGTGLPAAESVLPAMPPSADGTPGDPPPGWFLVAHLLAWTWPDGHQDQLRALARTWATASVGLDEVADRMSRPIGEIAGARSPEIDAAVARCTTVQMSVRRLASACRTLSATCDAYADHLDEAHSKTLRSLAALAAEVAATEIAAAALGGLTAGGSEAVAQEAVAVRSTVVAGEIAASLGRLAAIVDTLAAVLADVATGAAAVFASLADFVGTDVSAQLLQAVVLAEKSTLAAQLATAPTWGKDDFPDDGPPGGLRVRRDPNGAVTHYAVYDAAGLIVKRVDLVGKEHKSVPTPHVVYYEHNTDPSTGRTYIRCRSWEPRPAFPEEIP